MGMESFNEKKRQVHDALCDSIDTVTALQHMQALVKLTNIYIASKKQADGPSPSHAVVGMIAKYLTKMLKIFGANDGEQLIGFSSSVNGTAASNQEEMGMPFVQLLADFREDVRGIAKEQNSGQILKLCDELRDVRLIEIGVRLEDQDAGAPVVKLVDRETLLREKQQQLDELER